MHGEPQPTPVHSRGVWARELCSLRPLPASPHPPPGQTTFCSIPPPSPSRLPPSQSLTPPCRSIPRSSLTSLWCRCCCACAARWRPVTGRRRPSTAPRSRPQASRGQTYVVCVACCGWGQGGIRLGPGTGARLGPGWGDGRGGGQGGHIGDAECALHGGIRPKHSAPDPLIFVVGRTNQTDPGPCPSHVLHHAYYHPARPCSHAQA